MIPHLTIAYMTNRRYPCWQWFFDSLRRQLDEHQGEVKVVVVDFYRDERPDELSGRCLHVTPKPTVWQGRHRLTTRDYFAAANARNTALCCAPDGWVAYVDDLSVLLPGWLASVRQAMTEGYVALGAYRKVLGLEVNDGVVESFIDHPQGHDARWSWGDDEKAVRHGAGALFGCSLALPVETLLKVNGWDEGLCDGMGYEDAALGMCLDKIGCDMRYDRRMLTYESEELHHHEPAFVRVDKKLPTMTATCPDASHAMLRSVKMGDGRAHNKHMGVPVRVLRQRILDGGAFPVPTEPTKHWPDGQLLRSM